jgi:hypothetical protein
MSMNYPVLIFVLGIALLFAAGCTGPAVPQQNTLVTPVIPVTVPFGPVPVTSTDGVNIAYELEFHPADSQPLALDRVEVLDPATGKILYTSDRELLAVLYHPASIPPPTPAELRNGTGKISLPRVSLWFVVGPDGVPDRLTHRITLNRSASGQTPAIITGGDVVVRKNLVPVIIGSPLKGPGWFAMETTSPRTHHFSAQISMNGITRVPQRYAQDWIYLDPATGQAASGNASFARNYYGFGREIYAVANGSVMDARDGLPDIEMIYSAPPATVDTAAGNFVIVDIGNGKYACYAHMVNGSVRVKKGDSVKEGQVLGLMGNSGNSDLPHLHFQIVTDTPSFLGAEGFPHVYRSFTITGGINETRAAERFASPSLTKEQMWGEFGSLATNLKQPVSQENRLVENNAIVTFP